MRAAIAAGVLFLLSAVIGVITSVVTAHPTIGAWTALGAVVLLGTVIAVLGNAPDSYLRRRKKSVAYRSDGEAPIDVAARDPAWIFAAVGLDGFTGRQWLADEMDRFIASNQCGYFFVEADAGMGKTAFAAWLVKTRGYVSHFSRLGHSVRD